MDEVRVFIRPRAAVGPDGQRTTALRLRMNEKELGVHRLEKLTGRAISHQTIANLANGRGGVEKRKAAALADALGASVVELFVHGDYAEVS